MNPNFNGFDSISVVPMILEVIARRNWLLPGQIQSPRGILARISTVP